MKRFKKPMKISELVERISKMEHFLMREGYKALIEDKMLDLYPNKEYELRAVDDMIKYFEEREEYEKCQKLVEYLDKGKNINKVDSLNE